MTSTTSIRNTSDTASTATGAAVELAQAPLPPAAKAAVPNLSIGRSDRVPVDQMIRSLNLRSLVNKILRPAPSPQLVACPLQRSLSPTNKPVLRSPTSLAARFAAKPAATARSSANRKSRPHHRRSKPRTSVLEGRLAEARASENNLRNVIKGEQGTIHAYEDELAKIELDSGSLAVHARDLQSRLATATSRRKTAPIGSTEAAAVTGELRDLEVDRMKIIRVGRDLATGRTQKQGYIDQATLRLQAAEALLASIQPMLINVEGQIQDTRSMLQNHGAQNAAMSSAQTMNAVREKLQDMMQLLGGEHLDDFQSTMSNQAERDVRVQLREKQHMHTEAAAIIKSVTDKWTPRTTTHLSHSARRLLDDGVKVTSELRSNIARDAVARYGLATELPETKKTESPNESK